MFRRPTISVLLVMLAPRPAPAVALVLPMLDYPTSVRITETLVADYHTDNLDLLGNNDHYGDLRSRSNLNLSAGDLKSWCRFDTATFFRPPEVETAPYLDRYGLEKVSLAYERPNWAVAVGDFYSTVGRGIALRIRKDDELGEDTTLLGAKLRLDSSLVELDAAVGLTNPTNMDSVQEKTLADPYDLLSGLQARWLLPSNTKLGTHGVAVFFDPGEQNDQRSRLPQRAFVGGVSFDAPNLGDFASVYGEVNWMHKIEDPSATHAAPVENGLAAYLDCSLTQRAWTVAIDAKHYDRWTLESWTPSHDGKHYTERLSYIRPPTLEPETTVVTNNHDVTGARVRIEVHPDWRGPLFQASQAGFLAQDGDDPSLGNRWISHTRLGAELRFWQRGKASLTGGYRQERPDYAGGEHRSLYRIDAVLKIPLAARHSIDIHGLSEWVEQVEPTGTRPFVNGEWVLGYSWSGYLDLSLIGGYDTELSGERTITVVHETRDGQKIRQVFLAGCFATSFWEDRITIRTYAGTMRGGLKCVAGGCRYLPPFAGVRTELALRL